MRFKVAIIFTFIVLLFCSCGMGSNPTLLDKPTFKYVPETTEAPPEKDIVMTFTGDVSFADNWHIMQYCQANKVTPVDLIDDALKAEMKNADIAHMNNEFCISTKGTPLQKMYVFRGKPEYAKYYTELGIDFVTLANNHCFDYGEAAFLEMLEVLQNENIKYLGAGKNSEEAQSPIYYEIEGRTVAFVSATRAEKNIRTPEATEESPGVFRCYETGKLVETIKTAKQNADFVVAILHWGTEDSHYLEQVQRDTAKLYIDAGADLIVGGHAHCLQGVEYYNHVPIIYNLGNFLFSKNTIDTALLKVTLSSDNKLTVQMIPAIQKNCHVTSVLGTEDGKRILNDIKSYSEGITIDEEGYITEDTSA